MTESATIEALLAEGRTFPPPDDFKKTAHVVGTEIYDEADRDYEGFWARQAADLVDWFEEWHTILEWTVPFAKWFVGGKLNVSYNCLDRHVAAGHGDQVAYYWVGEPGDTRTITYAQLLEEVQRVANALKTLGIRKGDRVNIYLGMIPELPIAMLACARLGAPHSVVFGGFSSDALRDRIDDAKAKLLITADGAWRRGQVVPLKQSVSETIGPIAKPKSILFTDDLPKTRSGKIMRRLLRNVAEDEQLGDTTTLADPSVVEGIKSRYLDTAADEE